jgi:TonB family protein
MRTTILLFVLFTFLSGCSKSKQITKYAPIPIEKHLPDIPYLLSRIDVEGLVELSALVDENGDVVDAKVIQSISILDSVCIQAAKKWKFKPGKILNESGIFRSVKLWTTISFYWNSGRDPIVKCN